jgi:hypothetical protein
MARRCSGVGSGGFRALPRWRPGSPEGYGVDESPPTPVRRSPKRWLLLLRKRVRVPPPPPRVAAKVPRTVRVQTAKGGNPASPGVSLTGAWDNLQKRLTERAAVAYTDDFRNGLADWEGAGDWAALVVLRRLRFRADRWAGRAGVRKRLDRLPDGISWADRVAQYGLGGQGVGSAQTTTH